MTIKIQSHDAIGKLLAFLSARGKGRFEIPEALIEDVYASLKNFAKTNRVRITMIQPDTGRVELFAWTGATAGCVTGYLMGALPGAIAGSAIGFGIGLAVAHLKIKVIRSHENGPVIFDLL